MCIAFVLPTKELRKIMEKELKRARKRELKIFIGDIKLLMCYLYLNFNLLKF